LKPCAILQTRHFSVPTFQYSDLNKSLISSVYKSKGTIDKPKGGIFYVEETGSDDFGFGLNLRFHPPLC
jgi:hypothetical protein